MYEYLFLPLLLLPRCFWHSQPEDDWREERERRDGEVGRRGRQDGRTDGRTQEVNGARWAEKRDGEIMQHNSLTGSKYGEGRARLDEEGGREEEEASQQFRRASLGGSVTNSRLWPPQVA